MKRVKFTTVVKVEAIISAISNNIGRFLTSAYIDGEFLITDDTVGHFMKVYNGQDKHMTLGLCKYKIIFIKGDRHKIYCIIKPNVSWIDVFKIRSILKKIDLEKEIYNLDINSFQ